MKEKAKINTLLIIRISTIFLMALILSGVIIYIVDRQISIPVVGLILIITIWLIYRVLSNLYKPVVPPYIGEQRSRYHDVFFNGTVILSIMLVFLGIVYSVIHLYHDGNHFKIVGLLISVIWIAAFLIYFVWSVHHYNVNYGITSFDWDEIYKTKELQREGIISQDYKIDEPRHNPYRSQTFGLPPGTVGG